MASAMAAMASTCVASAAVPASQLHAGTASRRFARCAGLAPLRRYSRNSMLNTALPSPTMFVSTKREKLITSASLNHDDVPSGGNAVESLASVFADEHFQAMAGTTLAATLFAMLAETGSAQAAQEVMELAAADSRPLTLLIVVLPAVGWVLFNILKPALNQLDKMTGAKAVAGALGLGAAASLLCAPTADAAEEIARLAVADSRPVSLLLMVAPALLWVAFNILRPGLNQLEKMKGGKGAMVGALGLGAAATSFMVAAPQADAAQDFAQIAAVDNRPLVLLLVVLPAVGWVIFNILKPGLNQLDKMTGPGKAVMGGVGLAAAASALLAAPEAADAAQEIAQLAADQRPLLLLAPLVPAVGWVVFNILKPALNQLDKQLGNTPSKKKK